MKFPYGLYDVEPTPSQPGVAVVYRSVIPVRLIGVSFAAVFYGLLDSGADETLIPKEVADLVGVEKVSDQTGTILSASCEMPETYGAVTIEFGSGPERYRWRATVGIVDQPWKEALLGHIGFLRYFDVTFLGGQRKVQLARNTVALPSPC